MRSAASAGDGAVATTSASKRRLMVSSPPSGAGLIRIGGALGCKDTGRVKLLKSWQFGRRFIRRLLPDEIAWIRRTGVMPPCTFLPDGTLRPLTEGSTHAITLRVTHVSPVKVRKFSFEMP